MIVDDSMVARAVLSRMIESDPRFEIAAVAGTAEDAIEALDAVPRRRHPARPRNAGRGRPQVDSADHRRRRRRQGHDRLLAGRGRRRGDRRGARAGRRRHAAQAGHRPLQRPLFRSPARQAARRSATPTPRRPRPASSGASAGRAAARDARRDPIGVLAIGASTGGIHALGALFQALPPQIGVPILVTQHLPAPFMPVFARQLGDRRAARGAGRRGRHARCCPTASSSRRAMRI